jgi:hypothetical protein
MAEHRDETAADLYRHVLDIGEALERLHAERRVTMSADTTNAEWSDVDTAVAAARASLDVAAQAMAWMETLPR